MMFLSNKSIRNALEMKDENIIFTRDSAFMMVHEIRVLEVDPLGWRNPTKGFSMAKYNIETKIEVIRLYKSGVGSTTIARRLGTSMNLTVLIWIRLWDKHGLEGITRSNTLPRYSPSLKMKVIIWLVKHNDSYPETADHFDVSNQGTIWQWKH